MRRGGVRPESTVFLVGAVSYTVKSGWRGVSGVSLVGAASYTVKSGWLCVIHSEIWSRSTVYDAARARFLCFLGISCFSRDQKESTGFDVVFLDWILGIFIVLARR